MLGVRLREGLPLTDVPASRRVAVAGMIASGLVEGGSAFGADARIVLTRKGRLLADTVIRDLSD